LNELLAGTLDRFESGSSLFSTVRFEVGNRYRLAEVVSENRDIDVL